ncbi:unnamed protein product [Arabidopsis lyrata]|uniref:Predicted protein n=1 Tax=Arabidopsis lyrata subsp. lyrata TaxID=81972 RepID=D7MU24_ARALL|nr:probable disease resistance protein At5g45510 [Arabidopsis lyrata subsp. lyrata]EFH41504.1 predicted protein [Arabidopsis lyrata subsp. lyrata]CAH8278206.1 unnamed protein product [Arabidopsis lyrata]|eukprot:XP_002865245.1 probable disease resistance protein At5g45510 [Arabidopsis lyrata subsp. lyrata]
MASRAEMPETACREILKSFEDDNVSRVMLVGEAGMGKTWMARKIFQEDHAKAGSCYIALWLSLNKDFDEVSLYENIASQLSIFLDKEESEEDDSDEDDSEDDEDQLNRDLMSLKDKIHLKLSEIKLMGEGRKYLLLVLDDEGSVTSEKKVMKDLHLVDFLAPYRPLKILLTRRKGEEDAIYKMKPHATADELHAYSDGKIQSHTLESQILRDTFAGYYLEDLFETLIKYDLLESLGNADYQGFIHRIVEMSMGLPAAVVVIAKSLNYIALRGMRPFALSLKQDEVLKLAVLSSFPSVSDPTIERATSSHNPILHLVYELLKTDDTVKSSIVDCFWHSLNFFEHCGSVYYWELIAHWILEGYFDPVRSVTKAYMDAHAILMELINRGILKIQEDNVVMPEMAMKNLIDLRCRGILARSRISLAKVCGSDMKKGLGKINQGDDIIEAVRPTRKGKIITTVLVSGNRLRRETPEIFFGTLKDLEILGLFKPTLDHFVPSLLTLVKLRVLVIRDCDRLKDIEDLKSLEGLRVLEVSGASSLKKISDEFFKALSKLQSLHLSELQITSSPSSISELTELHCLIIKDCPLLEDLPDIQELVKLEVVDISGARGLQTCFDNRNFYHLTQLQLLDFSESQIERLPMFQDFLVPARLHSLARLLLHNCKKLRKLPNLKPLSGLQILDLSGSSSLVKILEVCFEDKKELRILNLSGTNLCQLPSTIEELPNLSELLLRDCTNLEALPNIAKLRNLEIFEVHGCTKLHKIDGSFEDMSYLREIDLSGTKVMKPPELPKESKLYCTKRITLKDKRPFKGKDWSQVVKNMQSGISENSSSSDAVVESQEISEKESGEIQSHEPGSSDFPVSMEDFGQFPIYRAVYQKSIPFVDSESHPIILEIHGSNSHDLEKETLAKAEFVSFVDCSSTRLTSVFNEMKSVKGCWLRMCKDIEYIFAGVEEERVGSLEVLSITNLRLLKSLSIGGSFKNLKRLSIDCCPNIKTLFVEASQLPSNLEVLHIKFCENLEKVSIEGEVSTLTTLCLHELHALSAVQANLPNLEKFDKWNCPNLPAEKENLRGLDRETVELTDASPQD